MERQGGHFESGVELFFLRRTNRSLRTRDSDRDHARLFALYGSPVVNSDTPDERARERERAIPHSLERFGTQCRTPKMLVKCIAIAAIFPTSHRSIGR